MSNPEEARSRHMSPDDFRRYAHEVVEWIIQYWREVEGMPVMPKTEPGDVLGLLPDRAPDEGEGFDAIFADFKSQIVPNAAQWQSPNFFGYFASNTSGPSILGDLIAAAIIAPNFTWSANPAATELELRVMDWLADLLGLPEKFKHTNGGGGVIQDTASVSSLVAILAARQRYGNDLPNLTAYISTETHSHVEKNLKIAGFRAENVRKIGVNDDLSMDVAELAKAVKADVKAGLTPSFVVATVGTTGTTAIDNVAAIGKICAEHNVWFHVDAALAGAVAICPEFRYYFDGTERADSYVFNPHKWLFTAQHCSALWVADGRAVTDALTIMPEYLQNRSAGGVTQGAIPEYKDWGINLGRGFRALKLWFVLRYYGAEGLRHHIRRHIRLAEQFAEWVAADARFELVNELTMNLVCFRHKGGDAVNQEILSRIRASGKAFITHTSVHGKFTLRAHIGQSHTELKHVENLWQLVQDIAAEVS